VPTVEETLEGSHTAQHGKSGNFSVGP